MGSAELVEYDGRDTLISVKLVESVMTEMRRVRSNLLRCNGQDTYVSSAELVKMYEFDPVG